VKSQQQFCSTSHLHALRHALRQQLLVSLSILALSTSHNQHQQQLQQHGTSDHGCNATS
jgi:hypothetical protein